MNLRFSILVPCKRVDGYAAECISHCRDLQYTDFEILVSPDVRNGSDPAGVKVVPSGEVGPAAKRDMMADEATGELLAFIDDDAYPSRVWLKAAAKHFEREEVAAVVGPAVTPSSDGLLQRCSGHVYSSIMGTGSHRYRYILGRQREVDDFPSCNFIMRKSVFKQIGGFSTSYWPGEDTKLCMDITDGLKKKIVYDPDVLVYHHRRKLFLPHLMQVWSYAVHRGYFAKKFRRNSLRMSYFLPSLLVIGVIGGIPLTLLHPVLEWGYLAVVGTYVIAVLISSLERRDLMTLPLVSLGTVATHFTYGVGFIWGLLTRDLKA